MTTKPKQPFPALISLCQIVAVLSCLAILSLVPGDAIAKVYKYIDDNGKIHYGDRPFSYRQDDFREGRSNERYKNKKINATLFHGLWDLQGYSKHLGNEISPDQARWLIKSDGSIKIQKGDSISDTRFRFQGKLIEIIEEQSWSTYQLISLSRKRLVIHNRNSDKYLYFNKKDDNPANKNAVKTSAALLYRREQVAQLIVLFTCSDILYSELSAEEKKSQSHEIFLLTGIGRFDEKKFSESVLQYKQDPIFTETYLPRIATDVKACGTKPNLPVLPSIQF